MEESEVLEKRPGEVVVMEGAVEGESSGERGRFLEMIKISNHQMLESNIVGKKYFSFLI